MSLASISSDDNGIGEGFEGDLSLGLGFMDDVSCFCV